MRKSLLIGIVFFTLLAASIGFWFAQQSGLIAVHPQEHITVVHLKENAPFKIKKRSEVLNHEVFRIISTRQPQEFLVLNHINPELIEPVFGKTPNLSFVNTIANQLLANANQAEETAQGPSVEIQSVKTIKTGTLQVNGQAVPYWQVRVKFKLSQEAEPREYEAALIRQPSSNGQEILTVSFAQENVFQSELMADLANNISLEEMQANKL